MLAIVAKSWCNKLLIGTKHWVMNLSGHTSQCWDHIHIMIKTTQNLEKSVGDAKQRQNPNYISIQFCILKSRNEKKTMLLHVVATGSVFIIVFRESTEPEILALANGYVCYRRTYHGQSNCDACGFSTTLAFIIIYEDVKRVNMSNEDVGS